jgi:hypothetical protein
MNKSASQNIDALWREQASTASDRNQDLAIPGTLPIPPE